MSIAKKCDRCGKFYEEYNAKPNEYKVNGFCLVTIRTEHSSYKHPWQDLCKDCMSELICWFLNPRFEGRNLTDEEAKIYDEWVNSESVKTGESLFEEGIGKKLPNTDNGSGQNG